MGNVCHAGPVLGGDGSKRDASPPASPVKRALTFGRDPTLKREDYIFSRVAGPSVLVKAPGSVSGQQFLVEECRDCDVFVLDHCTAVQIDECTNCRIVIGPCTGSLFLRNCSGCTLVCAAQQFRARDCKECDVFLYCATEPIIESSTRLRFSSFPLTYFSLQQQFDAAKFSVWNNRWSEIYNFTPDHGSWQIIPGSPNQSPFEGAVHKDEGGVLSLWSMPASTAEPIGFATEASQLIVPLSSGLTARSANQDVVVVCFPTPKHGPMLGFATAMTTPREGSSEEPPIILIQTRQFQLSVEQANALFLGSASLSKKAVQASTDSAGCVAMEFQGAGCAERATEILRSGDLSGPDDAFLSPDPDSARAMADLVFRQWRPTI